MTRSGSNWRLRRRNAGFSLTEALVTLLVTSIGLIGLAGLQATAIRGNHGALLRSQAVLKAHEALDRMRANRAAALVGSYNRGYGDPLPAQHCTTACTAVQMAAADQREWAAAVQRLPGGDGAIAVTAAGVATVRVSWEDDRDPATPPLEFRLETLL